MQAELYPRTERSGRRCGAKPRPNGSSLIISQPQASIKTKRGRMGFMEMPDWFAVRGPRSGGGGGNADRGGFGGDELADRRSEVWHDLFLREDEEGLIVTERSSLAKPAEKARELLAQVLGRTGRFETLPEPVRQALVSEH